MNQIGAIKSTNLRNMNELPSPQLFYISHNAHAVLNQHFQELI